MASFEDIGRYGIGDWIATPVHITYYIVCVLVKKHY